MAVEQPPYDEWAKDHTLRSAMKHSVVWYFQQIARRVGEIKDHHDERLERLRTYSVEFDRPATVPEFAGRLFSPRVQGPMADSETFAHLEHLRLAGQMECRERDGMLEYVVR